MVVAKSINTECHSVLKDLYAIESKTLSNVNLGITAYREGPLKDVNRCNTKAEVDYRDKPFPTV